MSGSYIFTVMYSLMYNSIAGATHRKEHTDALCEKEEEGKSEDDMATSSPFAARFERTPPHDSSSDSTDDAMRSPASLEGEVFLITIVKCFKICH